MRKHQIADEAQGFVLDAKYQQFEWAKRALEQARLELGGVIAGVGLSASARRIDRSRQWCLQVVQAAEERAREEQEARKGKGSPLPDASDLIESVRRSGILEPLIVAVTDDESLRVVDGHRRLRAAREAGVTSLPVMLSLIASDEPHDLRAPAEDAARNHRRVTFRYARPDGVEALRTVDVWGVVRRAEHAYLIGYDQDREAPRTFRLSRVVGGITFVGEGTPPPEGFSAEASVWGPLDPESLEALEESFRRVLKEQRASIEDEATDSDVRDEGARTEFQAEIDEMRLERRALEGERVRSSAAGQEAYESFIRLRTLLGQMASQVDEFSSRLNDAFQELRAARPRASDEDAGIEGVWQWWERLLAETESWRGELQSLHSVVREMEPSDLQKRRWEIERWAALDSAKE